MLQTLEEGLVDDAPMGLRNDHAGRVGGFGWEAGRSPYSRRHSTAADKREDLLRYVGRTFSG